MFFRYSPSGPCRQAILFVVVFAFSGLGTATAQTVSIQGNVGATFFRSPEPIKKILHSGSNLGLGANLHVTRGLSLTLEGTYNSFALNEDNARIYSRNGADQSFLGAAAGLRYTFVNGSDAHPYVAFGGGLYQLRTSNHQEIGNGRGDAVTEDEVQEGIHLALGTQFRLNETYALFLEPRYVFFDAGTGLGSATRYFTLQLGLDRQL